MSPVRINHQSAKRLFNPSSASDGYRQQWTNPADVFSVLLLLGGDVISRALGQVAGTRFAPVAFSFGWVAYAVSALVGSVGENKLMPAPDCDGLVINGESGNVRSNSSWVIGRIIRDFEFWSPQRTKDMVDKIINKKHHQIMKVNPNASKPSRAGLCVSIFQASTQYKAGEQPIFNWLSSLSTAVIVVQLGIAAIPCGLSGDWGILLITASGSALAVTFASFLPQWRSEKWACRRNAGKTVVLTRGNGAQHAIMILGKGLETEDQAHGLDLEDLAAVASNVGVVASFTTRLIVGGYAILWVTLLITAAGTKSNTWFLIAVGAVGILQNAAVAGWHRKPRDLGVPLDLVEVIADSSVMDALFSLEERYPRCGRALRDTFFQGRMSSEEQHCWKVFELEADNYEALRRRDKAEKEVTKLTELSQAVTNPSKSDSSTSSSSSEAAKAAQKPAAAQDEMAEAQKQTVDTEKIAANERQRFLDQSPRIRQRKEQWAWKGSVSLGNRFST